MKQRIKDLEKRYDNIMDLIEQTENLEEIIRLEHKANRIRDEWAALTGEDKEEELPYFDDFMKDVEFSIGSCDDETRMWILHNWYK